MENVFTININMKKTALNSIIAFRFNRSSPINYVWFPFYIFSISITMLSSKWRWCDAERNEFVVPFLPLITAPATTQHTILSIQERLRSSSTTHIRFRICYPPTYIPTKSSLWRVLLMGKLSLCRPTLVEYELDLSIPFIPRFWRFRIFCNRNGMNNARKWGKPNINRSNWSQFA